MRTRHALTAFLALAIATQSLAFAQAPSTPAKPGTPAAATPAPMPAVTATQPAAPAAAPVATATPPAVPAAAPATTSPAAPTAGQATTPAASSAVASSVVTTKKLYCPPISKLMKKDMFWGAPGGWRSYSQSFVSTIDSFAGAQWVGINLGKMLCVYKGKQTFEFPVVLQNDALTPTPEGGKWVVKAGGYNNCLSGDTLDCPFKFEETTTSKDAVNELDFFKGKEDYLKSDPSKQP